MNNGLYPVSSPPLVQCVGFTPAYFLREKSTTPPDILSANLAAAASVKGESHETSNSSHIRSPLAGSSERVFLEREFEAEEIVAGRGWKAKEKTRLSVSVCAW